MGSGVYRDIVNVVNAGRVVTVPRRTMDIGSWTGSGYIVTDSETGEAGYLISGGIAGGSSSTDVDLAYLADILFSIWDMGESVLLVTNALAAIEAGTALAGGIFLILGIVSLIFALGSFVETILLMDAYQNGNEQAGQELIKNSMINIGVTMATAALSHLAKPVVKYAAKNKLVREFGEEFVEKLAEHTDDFAGVKKGIRKLQKLGVSDDILREMGERFGTDGYGWLLKKRPLGLDNDILRKLTQADNFMDYSDELLDAVKNSDGHADDIIKAVSTYGDDAADAITKYGDDAADIIAKHGEDGLSWIKKYEKDAIDVIQEYGDEAVDSLKKGMTPDEVRLNQIGLDENVRSKLKDLLNSDYYKYDLGYDCSEIAEDFYNAAKNQGNIYRIEGKNGLIKGYEYGDILEFDYHEVYSDGLNIYDPRYQNIPVPKDDYFRVLKEINPEGFDVFVIK